MARYQSNWYHRSHPLKLDPSGGDLLPEPSTFLLATVLYPFHRTPQQRGPSVEERELKNGYRQPDKVSPPLPPRDRCPPCPVRLWWLTAGVWSWVLGLGSCLLANNNDVFVTRSIRGTDILQVRTELESGAAASNFVARITVANTSRPSPADRNLVVVLYMTAWGSGIDEGFSYTVPVRLGEGQSQVEVSIPAFQPGQQVAWDVAVFENGRDLEDRSRRPRNQNDFQWLYEQNSLSGIATIQGSTEQASQLTQQLQRLATERGRANGGQIVAVPGGVTGQGMTAFGRIVPIGRVDRDWRCFLPHYMWILSAATLMELQQNEPEAADALRTYLAAGGRLLVHSCQGHMRPEDVEQFLGRTAGALPATRWETVKTPPQPWWQVRPGNQTSEGKTPVESLTLAGLVSDTAAATETVLRSKVGQHLENLAELDNSISLEPDLYYGEFEGWLGKAREQAMAVFDSERFLILPYLAGDVIFCDLPLADVSPRLLDTVASGSSAYDTVTSQTSFSADGNWFWCNLIDAVGKPPVWTFAVIVTLFGLLLGPGLLVFTGRLQRRSLMIFLVPSLSLLATIAIVSYGVLHEGFDTHIRITSLTYYDAGTERAFVWSRQNYFSGLPPREGLRFNPQTYVRPVAVDENQSGGPYGPPRDRADANVLLTEGQQWRGWLRARQQQQLFIGHAGSAAEPPVKVARVNATQIRVENRTHQSLPFVLLRGGGADYFISEVAIPAGESVVLDRMSEQEVKPEIARHMVDRKPEPPSEMSDGGQLLSFGRRARRATTIASQDMIQNALRQYFSDALAMEPFTFATLTESNDLLEVPLQGQQSDGLHLVIGRQAW